jgi:hypothetical protein
MREIVFEVTQEQGGGYTAEAIGESIFTHADTWAELRTNVQEAVEAFFFDQPRPDQSVSIACGTRSSPRHEAAARS